MTIDLSACTIVPKDGPTGFTIHSEAKQIIQKDSNLDFLEVQLSSHTVDVAQQYPETSEATWPDYATKPASVKIGLGDVVSVTIFEGIGEAAGGGLFSTGLSGSREGNYVTIPSQQVGPSGRISVPYAGEVVVNGRSSEDVAAGVRNTLSSRAVDPQVVVTVSEHHSNEVSVLGEVYAPTRFSLEPGGNRILEAIARAGGTRYPAFESVVSLSRKGKLYKIRLYSIVDDPQRNIQVAPGDVIYIAREPRIFMAFGATPAPGSIGGQNNRRFIFEDAKLSLAEAIAKAGGLDGTRSEAKSVFLYRTERHEVLDRLGIDLRRYGDKRLIPTIYSLDLGSADGFFLASKFWMRNRDVLFVSDAPVSDFVKFMTILRSTTLPAQDIANTAQAASGIR